LDLSQESSLFFCDHMTTYSKERGLGSIQENLAPTPVLYDVDTCVVGGGAAGVAAAVSAARTGQKVLLIEREGFLGGTLTTVSLGSICGLYSVTPDAITSIVGGFADRVIGRLCELNAVTAPVRWLKTASLPYDLFAMKVALDRLLSDAGVTPLLHTLVVGVSMDTKRIAHVIVENKQGRAAVRARTFIDCSGDADLAQWSGAPSELDLEQLQQPTAMFRMGGVDPQIVGDMDRASLHRYLEAAVADGLPLPRTAGGVFMERPGVAHLNITKVTVDGRAPNPLNAGAMTTAETLGRAQVLMYQDAFRKYVPGFEQSYVMDSGSLIGIRESRRLLGEYVLGADDLRTAAKFDDAIGCCAWPMEDHATGRGTNWVWMEDGTYYQIPYRCLLPRGVDNLLVAGRCASATHQAQASLRVTAQCFVMGEAAGTAAVIANERELAPSNISVPELQRALVAGGAYLGTPS
jgi:hypothetical protein